MNKLTFLRTLSLEEAKKELGHFVVAKTVNGAKAMKNDAGIYIGAVAAELEKGQPSVVSRVVDMNEPEETRQEFWLLHRVPKDQLVFDPFED